MLSSIAFFLLRSPVGHALGAVLLLVGWTAYHRIDAAREAASECKQDQFEAQVAEKERQLAVAEKIAQDARDRASVAEGEMTRLREAANVLLEDPRPSCDIPDDVRQRLRAIR